jgi:chromosome segregation ATPase
MNKFSRILTIFVTVSCVAFMSVTAVMTTARSDTNWRTIATKVYTKTQINEQQQELTRLGGLIDGVNAEQKQVTAAIEADVKALRDPMAGREVELEQQLAQMEATAQQVAKQIEEQARKADAKLETLALRRDDVARLQNQFDEFVSQKQAAEAESKRLRDLLFQARGVLERVQRRRALLESQNGPQAAPDEDGYEKSK